MNERGSRQTGGDAQLIGRSDVTKSSSLHRQTCGLLSLASQGHFEKLGTATRELFDEIWLGTEIRSETYDGILQY